MPKTQQPLELVARDAGAGPRTPKVNRRLAAVLATAVTSSATRLAPWAPMTARSARNSSRYASVLSDADRGEPHHLAQQRPRRSRRWCPAELGARSRRPGSAPVAKPLSKPRDALAGRRRRWPRCRPGCRGRRPSRPAPRGCAARCARRAPAARCRRTSRCPRTCGSSAAGDVGADRLEAALRVGEPGGQRRPQDQVVAARDDLALGARAPPGSRGPAGCRSPGRSGRRSAAPPAAAARPDRWTGRRPCRPAPARRSRPHRVQRPAAALLLQRAPRTSGSSAASRAAIAGVASMLALSAMVIRNGNGNCSRQVAVQPADRIGQGGLLVVDRHDDVEHRHPALGGDAGRVAGEPGGCGVVRFECDGHVFMSSVRLWA